MMIFEYAREALLSVLIGVATFAGGVTDFFVERTSFFDNNEVAVHREDEGDGFSHIASFVSNSVPRVLLEHAEFQRAAVIASHDDILPATISEGKTLDDAVADALVNIYCQYKTEKYIRTVTGTGFFIDPKGVILTNAHVAQFLLLEDTKRTSDEVECTIRTGNPATPEYYAELLYISPTWVYENAHVIAEETPQGTGERDYALLYVSKRIGNAPLPTRFSAIPVRTELLSRSIAGTSVLSAGYPAEALMRGGADAELALVSASTTVGTLYTFGSNYADIFSIAESPVGEQGASGGPVVSEGGRDVIGLIVTKGDRATEGEHSLRALTLSYVDRTIIEETGFSLMHNMQGDVAERGAIFKRAMTPFLAKILEKTLSDEGQ